MTDGVADRETSVRPGGDSPLGTPASGRRESVKVKIRDLTKEYVRASGETVQALDGISLDVHESEFMVLLGPSGCGKTTLLRSIAGLEEPGSGSIYLSEKCVFMGVGTDSSSEIQVPKRRKRRFVQPENRNISMMFQSYALWPHMTLVDNVAYPLRIKGNMRKEEARAEASEYLDLVGLKGLEGQYAGQVSGGQQQRVALARTLANKPEVVLFDEPLSNVDANTRQELRLELLRLHRELKFTAIYVTHDQAEALSLGDTVALLNLGDLVEQGSPENLYDRPATEFAAEFMGSANIVDGEVLEVTKTSYEVRTRIAGDIFVERRNSYRTLAVGQNIRLMWRPEHATVIDPSEPTGVEGGTFTVAGEVLESLFTGPYAELACKVGDTTVAAWVSGPKRLQYDHGSPIQIVVPPDAVRIIQPDAETEIPPTEID